MSFEFGQPSFLALLALLPAWWWWVRPKGLAGLLIARGEPAEALALRGWKARMLETLPNAMRLAALGFLVLTLCQPRIVRTLEEPLTEGVGIAFAIDLSTSMWAADMAERTTRLQAAKATVLRFLENREDDVGLVSFAGESLIRLPVTHDVYVVEMAVDEMEVGLLTDGTDIAGAIAAGAGLLRDTPHTSKVLILVTDGAHNKAGIVPAVAARAAAARMWRARSRRRSGASARSSSERIGPCETMSPADPLLPRRSVLVARTSCASSLPRSRWRAGRARAATSAIRAGSSPGRSSRHSWHWFSACGSRPGSRWSSPGSSQRRTDPEAPPPTGRTTGPRAPRARTQWRFLRILARWSRNS